MEMKARVPNREIEFWRLGRLTSRYGYPSVAPSSNDNRLDRLAVTNPDHPTVAHPETD